MSEPATKFENSQSEIWELIRTLVLGQVSAAHVLELYYWSQDDAMLSLVRAVAFLQKEDRLRIMRFFSEIEPKAISVRESDGALIIKTLQGSVRN